MQNTTYLLTTEASHSKLTPKHVCPSIPEGGIPMKISAILATKGMKVVTIRPQQTLREAAHLLAQHNIGALVVVNESEHPVGIISERDIVRHAARDDKD